MSFKPIPSLSGDNASFVGDVFGTGDGNRITNDGIPYLLSGDSPAENDTLQDVTTRGNTTTNSIEVGDITGSNLTLDDNSNIYANGSGYLRLGNTSGGKIYVSGNAGQSIISPVSNDLYIQTERDGDDIIFKGGASVTEIMRLDADTQRVGIGTASPDAPLAVKVGSSTTEAKVFELLANDGRALSILQPDNAQYDDPWTFATNNSYTFRVDAIDALNIDSAGKVGIGTTNPSAKLHVSSDSGGALSEVAHFVGGGSTDDKSQISVGGNTSSALVSFGFRNTGSGFGYIANASDTEIITIDGGNERVGIGTTSPQAKLQVGDGSNDDFVKVYFSDGTNLDIHGYGIEFNRVNSYLRPTTNNNKNLEIGTNSRNWNRISMYSSDDFLFYNATTELVRITQDGKVGIGTTSPTNKLDIRQSTSGGSDVIGTGAITIGSDNPYWTFRGTATSLQDLAFDRNYSGTWYESMRIQRSTGNVGIGTASPEVKLHVGTSTLGTAPDTNADIISSGGITIDTSKRLSFDADYYVHGNIRYIGSGTAEAKLEYQGYYGHNFITRSGTSRMVIKGNTGNVGIGTTSPARTLDVVGDASISTTGTNTGLRITTSTSGEGYLIFGDPDDASMGGVSYNNSTNALMFDANNAEHMRITSAGNVGIGITTPNNLLNLSKNVADGDVAVYIQNFNSVVGSTNETTSLKFAHGNDNTLGYEAAKIIGGKEGDFESNTSNVKGFLSFSTASGTSLTNSVNNIERMRITGAGNVGIGTTSPRSGLDIGDSDLYIGNHPTTRKIYFGGTANYFTRGAIHTTQTNLGLYNDYATGYITLNTNSGEAVRVDEDGNVGIGTTSPSTKLQIGSSGSLGSTTNKVINTTFDSGYSTANSLQYQVNAHVGTTASTAEIFTQTSGEVLKNFYVGLVSDTSYFNNSTYSITQGGVQRMVVKMGGNVGIGTNNPSAKLHVQGSSATDVPIIRVGGFGNSGSTLELAETLSNGDMTYGFSFFNDGNSSNTLQLKRHQNSAAGATIVTFNRTDNNVSFAGGLTIALKATSSSTLSTDSGTTLATKNYVDAQVGSADTLQEVTDNGNTTTNSIGIGTTSPVGMLSVVNPLANTNTWTPTNKPDLWVSNAGTSNSYYAFGITTSSGDILSVTNAGNVGIGTTSPAAKLHVADSSSTSPIRAYNGSYYASIGANNNAAWVQAGGSPAHGLRLSAGANGAMSVYASRGVAIGEYPTTDPGADNFTVAGNVGIGTTSPSQKLDVQGTIIVNNEIQLVDSNMRIFRSSNDLRLRTGGNDRVTINSTGNVGIGTTSPSYKLSVSGGDFGVTNGNKVYIGGASGDSVIGYLGNTSGKFTLNSDGNRDVIIGSGTDTDAVFIKGTNGNVGIGTVSPSAKLHVHGTSFFFDQAIFDDKVGVGTNSPSEKLEVSGNLKISSIGTGNSASSYDLLFYGTTSSGTQTDQAAIHSSPWVTNSNGGNLIFETSNTSNALAERMRIDGVGNVGIGTTSPTVALDVAGAGKFTGQVTIPATPSASTDAASKGYVDAQVGSADTLQEVTDNGNTTTNSIGIGTTSPSKKLEVNVGGTSSDGILVVGSLNPHIEAKDSTNSVRTAIASEDSLGKIGTISSTDLKIVTGNTERIRIESGGQVGIGIANPNDILQVKSSMSIVDSNGTNVHCQLFSNASEGVLRIYNGSNWGLIARGQSNNPYLGAYYGGSLNIVGFSASDGSTIQGTLATFDFSNSQFKLYDDKQLVIGNGADLKLYHNGSHSYVVNNTGDLEIVNNTNDGDIKLVSDDGSGGTATYVSIDGSAEQTRFFKDTRHTDGVKANFGNSDDLQIYHTGTDSIIKDAGTGGIKIDSNYVQIRNASGTESQAKFIENGAVELYYDDSKKFETTTNGVVVTGSVVASAAIVNQVTAATSGGSIKFKTNSGADKAIILDNGNFGIGTNTPNQLLEIDGGTENAFIQLTTPNDRYGGIAFGDPQGATAGRIQYYHGDNSFQFDTDGKFTFEGGNVGIGTTSPNNKLDVVGSASIDVLQHQSESTNYWALGTSASYQQRVTSRTATAITQVIEGHSSQSADLLQIRSSSASNGDYVTVNSDGDVGIGTTSPAAKLHVQSLDSNVLRLANDEAVYDDSQEIGIDFYGRWYSSQPSILKSKASIVALGDTDGYQRGQLSFRVANDGAPSEVVRIDRQGNVGIGVTNPSSFGMKLEVAGGGLKLDDVNFFTTYSAGLAIQCASANNPQVLIAANSAVQTNPAKTIFRVTDNTFNTPFLNVVGGGNVGIGTTNPIADLHVNGDVQIGSSTQPNSYGALQVNQTSNVDEEGIGVLSASAGRSIRIWVDETRSYINSGNGGSGDLILNEGAGNVGIGTTNPNAKLHVAGSARIGSSLNVIGAITNSNGTVRIESASGQEVEIASTRDIRLLIDSNNDDTTNRFEIQSNTSVSNDNNIVFVVEQDGKVGIGTTAPCAKLEVNGHFAATSKSFIIDHPTKEDKKLQYASLEGPENGVYVRGTTDKETIELPEYWSELVHEDSITVVLTPIGKRQDLFIIEKSNKLIKIGGAEGSFDYVVYGERKDIDKLEIEPLKV